jgi:hypothetical protein
MFAFFVEEASKFEMEGLKLLQKEINVFFSAKEVDFYEHQKIDCNFWGYMSANKAPIFGFSE